MSGVIRDGMFLGILLPLAKRLDLVLESRRSLCRGEEDMDLTIIRSAIAPVGISCADKDSQVACCVVIKEKISSTGFEIADTTCCSTQILAFTGMHDLTKLREKERTLCFSH